MKARVYIETTIISYLAARPSRDLIVAARQELTRDWWEHDRGRYELCTSRLVIDEASVGDPIVAGARISLLSDMTMMHLSTAAEAMADDLIAQRLLPAAAGEDALHLAIAVDHGLDYLLTWNCRHLANATLRSRLELQCARVGLRMPVICTPEELKELDDDLP